MHYKRAIVYSLGVASLLLLSGAFLLLSNASTTTHSEWKDVMLHTPVSSAGCFEVTYPSISWVRAECDDNAPTLPLAVGGNHYDEAAQVPSGDLIQTSDGDFSSVSGVTSITDNESGPNDWSIQENSNYFNTTYGGATVTAWVQFAYANTNSSSQGNHGDVEIWYWLINYTTVSRVCPGIPWVSDGVGDCYYKADPIRTNYETPSSLSYLSLKGLANCSGCGGHDEALFCDYYNCWTSSYADSTLGLSSSWIDSEWNILGYDNGSQAQFNSGSSLTLTQYMTISGGGTFTPSCIINGNYTAESNNLNLYSCTTNSGGISVTEN